MYSIEIKLADRRIDITIAGFWDLDETLRYEAEIVGAMKEIRRSHPYFDLLLHADSLSPVAKENADVIERIGGAQMQYGLRKSAMVCPSALTQMQLRRLGPPNDHFRMFQTDAEALAWLAE